MHRQLYTLAAKKFFRDYGFLRASALTFYTLFAVVPILATAFGVAKGFGLEKFLNTQLEKLFPGQETVVQFLSQYAQNLLERSSGGIIAGVALLILFYSVYSMLNHIEQAFNEIWQVTNSRSVSIRVSHYLSMILIAPIILVAAGSLKIFIAKQFLSYNLVLSWSSSVVSLLLIILFFTWVFQYMPNIKVNTRSALFGGIHTGIAYTLIQSFLIESQLVMNNYGPVYGSLAALPIFLLWVQISWVTVLYGAQLCFMQQNNIKYPWELNINDWSRNSRNTMLIKLVERCIAQFRENKPALTEENLCTEFDLAPCCVQQLLAELIKADLLVQTGTNQQQHGYLPARNIELLDINSVMEAINSQGVDITATV